jgi:D-alanine-D-alanine ligase
MRIGLTYDLRTDYLAEGWSEQAVAEFDRPDTIDAIERELRALGHDVDRIGHVKRLVERLARGDRWDLVFNIAESLHGRGREAVIPALLEQYEIPYTFSDPLIFALTLDKGMTKRMVRSLGINTPDFAVVSRESDLATVDMAFPLFAKPIAEGSSKGVDARSKVKSQAELEEVCRRLLKEFRQPVLVEAFLPGREFTVGITGTGDAGRVIGVMEVHYQSGADAGVYTYRNKEDCESLIRYSLADDALARASAELALEVWRGLGCRDSGRVDVRADANGKPSFVEINPLAGLHPEHSDLPIMATLAGVSYHELIRRIVASASERVRARATAATR